ncbi:MAG: PaaI family thioesterase [Halieaceae bacterium]|nr:PaaI family thioesterase [Halieaceae bacterium]
MSDKDTERYSEGLPEAINRDVARLIQHLRCSNAPDKALAEATDHVQEALKLLEPWLQAGEGWSTISVGSDIPGFPWKDDDLTACMPYSPISGKRNPVALPLHLWKKAEGEVGGEIIFSPTYAGPPDSVHGGMIAAVFDELLAMSNVISGTAGFTGTLTIRYRRKTPLNTPIELWAKNVRQDGRKQLCRGEMRVGGEVTATAEGLFICAAENTGHGVRGESSDSEPA